MGQSQSQARPGEEASQSTSNDSARSTQPRARSSRSRKVLPDIPFRSPLPTGSSTSTSPANQASSSPSSSDSSHLPKKPLAQSCSKSRSLVRKLSHRARGRKPGDCGKPVDMDDTVPSPLVTGKAIKTLGADLRAFEDLVEAAEARSGVAPPAPPTKQSLSLSLCRTQTSNASPSATVSPPSATPTSTSQAKPFPHFVTSKHPLASRVQAIRDGSGSGSSVHSRSGSIKSANRAEREWRAKVAAISSSLDRRNSTRVAEMREQKGRGPVPPPRNLGKWHRQGQVLLEVEQRSGSSSSERDAEGPGGSAALRNGLEADGEKQSARFRTKGVPAKSFVSNRSFETLGHYAHLIPVIDPDDKDADSWFRRRKASVPQSISSFYFEGASRLTTRPSSLAASTLFAISCEGDKGVGCGGVGCDRVEDETAGEYAGRAEVETPTPTTRRISIAQYTGCGSGRPSDHGSPSTVYSEPLRTPPASLLGDEQGLEMRRTGKEIVDSTERVSTPPTSISLGCASSPIVETQLGQHALAPPPSPTSPRSHPTTFAPVSSLARSRRADVDVTQGPGPLDLVSSSGRMFPPPPGVPVTPVAPVIPVTPAGPVTPVRPIKPTLPSTAYSPVTTYILSAPTIDIDFTPPREGADCMPTTGEVHPFASAGVASSPLPLSSPASSKLRSSAGASGSNGGSALRPIDPQPRSAAPQQIRSDAKTSGGESAQTSFLALDDQPSRRIIRPQHAISKSHSKSVLAREISGPRATGIIARDERCAGSAEFGTPVGDGAVKRGTRGRAGLAAIGLTPGMTQGVRPPKSGMPVIELERWLRSTSIGE